MEKSNVVMIMMAENIFGREIARVFLEAGTPLNAVIVERGNARADRMRNYLNNPFYTPPELSELVTVATIHTVKNLNGDDTKEVLESLEPDIIVLGGTSRIIKPNIYSLAKRGCVNAHPGKLPEFRGLDPVTWALFAGEEVYVSCHIVDEGVDTGPLLLSEEVEQVEGDTILRIRIRAMQKSAEILQRSVIEFVKNQIVPEPQKGGGEEFKKAPPPVQGLVERKLAQRRESQSKPYFLEGKRTALRALEEGDYARIAEWVNDPAITHFMFYGQRPLTLVGTRKFIGEHLNVPRNVVFTIVDRNTSKAIGFGGLYNIHLTARSAEFRILIGDRSMWGRGYGTEVTQLLTWYGFDRLNMNRIWLGVTEENHGAVRAYEKAGYTHEGILRADIYRNGRFYNTVRMSVLREEFYRTRYASYMTDLGKEATE
jgi:RimJ/RimL family protein N-acetyltransferase/methionyl-tRNA formyltransferase